MNAAMARPWRIIHIAGHGEPPLDVDGHLDPRGVVLSDKSFLAPQKSAPSASFLSSYS